ncbi:50S ribosomal protein L23, partial [Campylobacter jejuni]
EYFGVTPVRINSLKMDGKIKRFRGREGQRNSFKKFYVKLPEGVSLESSEA